jgi:AraC family transcriptional regulator
MDTENTRTPTGTGKLSPERLAIVERLVAERLGEAIHVEDLAAAAGLSPFHFSRMFHAATGKAPHAYVTAKRMEAACRLLATTDIPLVRIATQVGYRTQAHFTGVFHRHVGVTPRTYRVSKATKGAARTEAGEAPEGHGPMPGAKGPEASSPPS